MAADSQLPVVAVADIEQKLIAEFRLKLLKDEIAAQSNTFDQIDSKTGVALGFTFVAVGQVLASVFRMSTDQNHFRSSHPYFVDLALILANLFVFLAIICGVISRWPRSFHNAIEWVLDGEDEIEERNNSYLELVTSTIQALEGITQENEQTNVSKSTWAKYTYIFAGLALVAYLVMTITLYLFSIPRN
jgi:hypothetical protein